MFISEIQRRQAYEEYKRLCEEIERLTESKGEHTRKEMNEKYAGKYFREPGTSNDIDIRYAKGFNTPDECVCDRACKTECGGRADIHFYKNDVFIFKPACMVQITYTEYLDTLKEIFKSAQELETTQYEY